MNNTTNKTYKNKYNNLPVIVLKTVRMGGRRQCLCCYSMGEPSWWIWARDLVEV